MKKQKAKLMHKISIVVLCVTILLILIYFAASLISKKKANDKKEDAYLPPQQISSSTLPPNPIDFKSLKKGNEDIYAWIKIDNTNVDYPVVQSYEEDDYFYLNHNIEKKFGINGAIYTEKHNKTDFSDPNTVIYGHDMLDGSMFRTLHKFRDEKFFKENEFIYIYTEGHILKYRIFAAYKWDNRHILNSYDFSDEKVFADYLEEIKNPKSLMVNKRDVDLTTSDKIITLSTCIGNEKNYRYLVQGVLIDDTRTQ